MILLSRSHCRLLTAAVSTTAATTATAAATITAAARCRNECAAFVCVCAS